ncbi:Rpn family recombination-promoting nuclease/putative transposase [Iningainema tapete]|uniref:Rpn family recombination-promoting nuclease/putative transposase n=1 Tax=Iningainema tapete TaxID=2806730 RepID=UPI001EE34F51|nr:Rpn family recombination-promoting nuclease/putative transposase [Iningainema tapete]
MDEVPAIHQAFEVAKQSKLSKKELEVLEKREMFLHDSRNAILKARLDGEAKGREEGREEETSPRTVKPLCD